MLVLSYNVGDLAFIYLLIFKDGSRQLCCVSRRLKVSEGSALVK